ncbi:MAG: M48 family metalloprotease [Candidatus Methanoplasma sp.]|jgi:heat shock protein HtpX|nr:M48 family metalloprotease [Candidatus Methanoplasma sp.]
MIWQVRTASMFIVMSLIFMAVGSVVGALMGSFILGLIALLSVAVVFSIYSYFFSKQHALKANGARIVTQDQEPRLYGIVSKVAGLAGVPMPEVGIVESMVPNAFATGRNPKNAAVVATRGILSLADDELEGVIAHEMAHVKNRDILVMSVASTMAAVLSYLSRYLLYAALFGRERDPKLLVAAIACSILVPVAAVLVQLGVSRNREYLADETGAKFTGNPRALARALKKIESGCLSPKNEYDNTSYADMWIANPVRSKKVWFKSLFSTHPPMDNRIAKLNALADKMESTGKYGVGYSPETY